MEEPIINELVLVCSVLGSEEVEIDSHGVERRHFVRSEDCLEWLYDLQRVLRRDDEVLRPVSSKLGSWRVVEKKLLPLLLEYRDDRALVLTLCKIFVTMTMPLHETTAAALTSCVDREVVKENKERAKELMKLRSAAVEQSTHLFHFLSTFARPEVLGILASVLEAPLARPGHARGEEDNLIIELVLTLVRNLLAIGTNEHEIEAGLMESARAELFTALHKELMLEVVILLCQNITKAENRSWNLLLMEILWHLLHGQETGEFFKPVLKRSRQEPKARGRGDDATPSKPVTGLLRNLNQSLRNRRKVAFGAGSNRHSHFGGTFQGKGSVSAKSIVANPFRKAERVAPPKRRQGGRRKGSKSADGAVELDQQSFGKGLGPFKRQRLRESLCNFCDEFMKTAFGPFCESLKNEFRLDSSRLQSHDKRVYFDVVNSLARFQLAHIQEVGSSESLLRQLLVAMDIFSFRLVLDAMTSAMAENRLRELSSGAQVYAAMLQCLHQLATVGTPESEARLVALGLAHRLYYNAEPLTKTLHIMRQYKVGIHSPVLLGSLMESLFYDLRILSSHREAYRDQVFPENPESGANLLERKRVSRDYDIEGHVIKKIATNQVLSLFPAAIAAAPILPPRTNFFVGSILERVRVTTLSSLSPSSSILSGLASVSATLRVPTLAPLLLQLPVLFAISKLFKHAQQHPEFASVEDNKVLIDFGKSLVADLRSTLSGNSKSPKNAAAFLDVMFTPMKPLVFCEKAYNFYCTEDDILTATGEMSKPKPDDEISLGSLEDESNAINEENDDEEEQEWAALAGVPSTKKTKKKKKKKNPSTKKMEDEIRLEDSDDEQDWDARLQVPPSKTKKRRLAKKNLDDVSSDDEEEWENDRLASATPKDVHQDEEKSHQGSDEGGDELSEVDDESEHEEAKQDEMEDAKDDEDNGDMPAIGAKDDDDTGDMSSMGAKGDEENEEMSSMANEVHENATKSYGPSDLQNSNDLSRIGEKAKARKKRSYGRRALRKNAIDSEEIKNEDKERELPIHVRLPLAGTRDARQSVQNNDEDSGDLSDIGEDTTREGQRPRILDSDDDES